MPSLKGYEVQTHPLPDGREIDVLHAPDDDNHLWVPGQQVAELASDGWRSSGRYSTSDISQRVDRPFVRREPDPHKLYSRTRTRSTTLLAVEGLIQKTFHTKSADFISFCYEFLTHVLPAYPAFAAHHAELIMAWYEALYHFNVTGNDLHERTFRAAAATRDSRWLIKPSAKPMLVIGTLGCMKVMHYVDGKPQLASVPLVVASPTSYEVAELQEAHVRAEQYRKEHEGPPVTPQMVMRYPDGSISFNQIVIVPATVAASPEPSPETEVPVESPLPGVPAVFVDQPCPTYGSYEDPQWIGLYVCDVLKIAKPHQALSRVPAEERGTCVVGTPGGPQVHITLKEPGLYRLISTSHKPAAKRFKNWLFRDVLPSIRKYGHYTAPGAKAGPTADDVREALRALMQDALPEIIEPAVLKAVKAHISHGDLAELVKVMGGNYERLAEIVVIGREQLELSRQSIDLITPGHQLFLSAKDYVEGDGVTDALRKAPTLAKPSFGLEHCPDYGKASLWMKRLCRAENRKVGANAVAILIAEENGEEIPPLYIPKYRMKKLTRDHVKVLVFNPACWARCKQTFLLAGTPTLRFPGPKAKPAPDDKTKAEEA